jgi:carboxymethylenebutenolidase
VADPVALSIPGRGRTLDAFLATPLEGTGPFPALIVVHEVFGPDAHIRDVAGRFARAGYLTIAPNLFTGELQALLTPEAVTTAMGFLRALPPEILREPAKIQEKIRELPPEQQAGLTAIFRIQDPGQQRRFGEDLRAVAEWLRSRPDVVATRVGCLGFCFGGGMAGMLAGLDTNLAAAVIFYGNNPPAELILTTRAPVLGHYGSEDHRITDTLPALVQQMASAGVSFESYVYPGASHAFFNDTRPVYHKESAELAWTRTLTFLDRTLKGPHAT